MLILCLAAAMLGGCAKRKNHGLDPKSPTTITIWHYYNGVQQENFDNLLMTFNETVGREMGIAAEARSKNSINDLAEYTSDDAFDAWYADFVSGLEAAAAI